MPGQAPFRTLLLIVSSSRKHAFSLGESDSPFEFLLPTCAAAAIAVHSPDESS
jgi:hypothetical protein